MKKLLIALSLILIMLFAFVSCQQNIEDDMPEETDTSTNTGGNQGGNTTCAHVFNDDWVEVRPASCVARGYYERFCTLCGQKSVKYTNALGHNEVKVPAVAPTCVKPGFTEGTKCTNCNQMVQEQREVRDPSAHSYTKCISVAKYPTISDKGEATFRCEYCKNDGKVTLDKLVVQNVTKADVYKIESNNEYNPAIDNMWKVFDGNKNTAGIYATGDDWFGNVGDKLIITLKQPMVLSELNLYLSGNYTFCRVIAYNVSGKAVLIKNDILANGSAYGGTGQKVNVFTGNKTEIYQIAIEITSIKESYQTFKVSEVELKAAATNLKLPHTHDYREYTRETVAPTCTKRGQAMYECFCGEEQEYYISKKGHSYNIVDTLVKPSCTEDGSVVYKCECGLKDTAKVLYATGHKYEKLVSYITQPTKSAGGEANFKCIGCNQTEKKQLSALSLEEINYLRVESIKDGKVTLKFNVYSDPSSYEIRYSQNEITSENYNSATKINGTVSGNREITVELSLDAGLDKCYYVAIKPYCESNYGEMASVRVGGNLQVEIDYHSARVYHGEVLNSFAKLFDEQRVEIPTTVLAKIFNDSGDSILYGSNLAPIIDLEYGHYITSVKLYYADAGKKVTVRWSNEPVDFQAEDGKWDGVYELTSAAGWNTVNINATTRYIQVIFKDGEAPYEMTAFGYQCGESDAIATERRELPTIGEMIGMCGFVAIGEGNTPINSVICTTVLREYHNIGWSYVMPNYPRQAMFFTSGNMGNFDSAYKSYFEAGINVIPCFQWALVDTYSVSYRVNDEKLPIQDGNGKYIMSTFWERFDPHTYFGYADAMFSFSARYGSSSSAALLNTVAPHISDRENVVGLGYIKWIEIGNEPDGSWNGIHNYYSAYQLAALTSAAYDGHGRTLRTPATTGYHLGAKNADPNMQVALAGVSGISNEYITALCYWMRANRADGKVALDAFNVHNYMSKAIEIEGNKLYIGISPEEADLVGTLSQLIEIRNKYYPEKEVWLSEFGWDTNQSYATVNSAHAYGEYTGRQVQAMWLTRAYLLLSAVGVDKATMYMCEDTGVENLSVGKFGTSGVIGYEYDEFGNKIEVKKDSYYYLYTLKNTLGDYTFNREIEAYDENVMIYEYVNESGDVTYALWCKTSDGTKAMDYQLKIDGTNATLIEAVYGDTDGTETHLVADQLGYISVNVSENPIYIQVK